MGKIFGRPFFTRTQRFYLYQDWERLVGAIVEVRLKGLCVRSGRVDAVTANGAIVWIAQEGALGRVLIDKSEGYEIWIAQTVVL
jgi:hypothetical protein